MDCHSDTTTASFPPDRCAGFEIANALQSSRVELEHLLESHRSFEELVLGLLSTWDRVVQDAAQAALPLSPSHIQVSRPHTIVLGNNSDVGSSTDEIVELGLPKLVTLKSSPDVSEIDVDCASIYPESKPDDQESLRTFSKRMSYFNVESNTRAAYQAALMSVEDGAHWRPACLKGFETEGNSGPLKRPPTRAESLVESSVFVWSSVVLILLNVLYISYGADTGMKDAISVYNGGRSSKLSEGTTNAIDIFFSVAFSLELLLRMLAFRCVFWLGPDWRWNLFDFVVVVGGAIETVITVVSIDTNFLRLVRFLRILRTVQVVRKQPMFSKLRLMLLAVFESVISLMWAMLLLVGFMLLFAVIFVQTAAHHIESAAPGDITVPVLTTFFHSLPMALLTLCMAITGGVNWWTLMEAFLDFSPFCAAVFLVYIALMVLALLNIVTGIFVNDSIEVAQSDRELRTISLLHRNAETINRLKEMFREIDEDCSGSISLDEFMSSLSKTEVRLALEALGVDLANAVRLFETLDVDGDRQLEIDEFVMGCSALCVSAKTLDMEMLKSQNKKIMKKVALINLQLDRQAKPRR